MTTAPVAAATHTAAVSAGTITFTKTGITPEVINLNPTTASCSDLSLTVTDTGTTIIVTALSSSHVQTFANGGTYLAVLTRSTSGNTAGALNSTTTPHTITNMRTAIVATIYNTTSCTPTGTPVCTLAVLLNLSGNSTSLSAGQTFSLTGASVGTAVAFPTCTAGPSFLVGSSSTVTTAVTGVLGDEGQYEAVLDSGGDLVLGGTVTVPLSATAGAGCAPVKQWYWHRILGGNWSKYRKSFQPGRTRFTAGTTDYVADITHVSNTEITAGDTTYSGSSEVIQLDVYTATDQGVTYNNCSSTGPLVCRLIIHLILQGIFNQNVHWSFPKFLIVQESANTLTNAITTSSCTGPFTALDGGTADLNGTEWEVTAIL